MKKNNILPLLKRELFLFLINPAIWISSIIFVLAIGIHFYFGNSFFVLGKGSSDLRLYFAFIPYISILYIPSLTMSLWANEEGISDTLPVSTMSLVLVKWLASLIVFFITFLVTLIIPLSILFFGDISGSNLICGIVGIFLFGSALLAFAQWASCLTKSPVGSFCITALILSVMNSIHLIPLYINLPTFLTKITNYLSFAWHFDAAGKGILDTRDIFFYIITTVFFLSSAWYIQRSRQKKVSKKYIWGMVTLLILFLWNSQVWFIRIDTTKNQQYSLSSYSKELVDSVNESFQITYYLSKELTSLYPQVSDVSEFLRSYNTYSNKIGVTVINPETEDIQADLKAIGIQSQQIESTNKGTTSFVTVYSGIVLEYEGITELVPFVLSTASLEYDIASRMQSMLYQKQRQIMIYVGNGLSLETDYSYVLPWLQSAGFSCIEITHIDETVSPEVPLIILGNSEMDKVFLNEVESFVLSGGKVLFSVSRNYTDMYSSWNTKTTENTEIIPLLNYWGFNIEPGLVMDLSNYRITMQGSSGNSNDLQYVNYPFWIVSLSQNLNNSLSLTKGYLGLESYWASPMNLFEDSFGKSRMYSVVNTSPSAWVQLPQSNSEYQYITDPFYENNLKVNRSTLGQYAIVGALVGSVPGYSYTGYSLDTRIIVIPDQYIFSNMIEYTNSPHNMDFLINCSLWLSEEDELLELKQKGIQVTSLYKITDEAEFSIQVRKTIILVIICYTLFFVFLFVGVTIKRKQRNVYEK